METILTGAEARSKLLVGVNKVANSIKGTLGPNARTVIIQNPMGMPVILNDGVSIARAVHDKDPYVQMGIDLLKEVASEAQDKSGDGTTSATLIAQTLCNGSLSLMEKGVSPLKIRDDLKKYLETATELLQGSVMEDFDLLDVATIASNNDSELGELIASAVEKSGTTGGLTIEKSTTGDTYVRDSAGFEMNAGYAHVLMANAGKKVEYDEPMVVVTTEKIESFNALIPSLQLSVEKNRPLVIFCSDFNPQMLQNLLVNIVQGKVSVCMVKPAGMPQQKQEWLEDVAHATGANLFSVSLKESIMGVTEDDLGSCERLVSTTNATTITLKENVDTLENHIETLIDACVAEENDWLTEQIQNRINRLTTGISTIYVGGASDIEQVEKKERVDDAVNACKLALESGVVIGGGAQLYRVANEMSRDESGEVFILFYDALLTPIKQIVDNSGGGDMGKDWYYLDKYSEDTTTYRCGVTGELRDAMEDGVLDPMQVVLNSLESAVSIAGLVLMTDVAIIAPSD